MRDQLAIRADHDVRADDAIGTDRRALADHSAILNSRGGVDRTHRMVRYQSARLHADVFDFSVVSVQCRYCPVTDGYAVFRCVRVRKTIVGTTSADNAVKLISASFRQINI